MSTIFSKIIKGEIPCYKIAENDKFFAFLDINPMVKGHTLVIPKHETDYFFDIEDTELSDMMVFAKQVAKQLKIAFPSCERVGVMVAGFDVPHAHVHLIPMQSMKDLDISKERLKLSSEEFTSIADKITKQK